MVLESHVIGVDDAPFSREHRGDVRIVGTAYSRLRLEAVLSGQVRRDGSNATRSIATMILSSRYAEHTKMVMLQGIALAGFNVVDLHKLKELLNKPVLVVARKQPNYASIREALLSKVRGGAKKWALIEKAGAMEALGGLYVQRAGLTLLEAEGVLKALCVHGHIPEPLRVAHLIAGGVTVGESRGRA